MILIIEFMTRVLLFRMAHFFHVFGAEKQTSREMEECFPLAAFECVRWLAVSV